MSDKLLFWYEASGHTEALPEAEGLEKAEAKVQAVKKQREAFQAEAAQCLEAAQGFKKKITESLRAARDPKILQGKRQAALAREGDIRACLEELERIVPQMEKELADGPGADLERALRAVLDEDRAEMIRQLEAAWPERDKTIRGPERRPVSTPPEVQSPSRLACCESCKHPIAVFDPEEIKVPMTGAAFREPRRGSASYVFPPKQEYLYFVCPVCGKRPWAEPDKILTSRGFFVIGGIPEEPANVVNE